MVKMKKKAVNRKVYQKPTVQSEKETREIAMNCPSTNTRYCSWAYSPKKG
jgi:hypothetical protein